MPDPPLWSERHGGSIPLTAEGLAALLVDLFDRLAKGWYFAEVLNLSGRRWNRNASRDDVRAFFAMRLGDPWAASAMGNVTILRFTDEARTFDLLELLHRDVVSKRVWPEPQTLRPSGDDEGEPPSDLRSIAETLTQLDLRDTTSKLARSRSRAC